MMEQLLDAYRDALQAPGDRNDAEKKSAIATARNAVLSAMPPAPHPSILEATRGFASEKYVERIAELTAQLSAKDLQLKEQAAAIESLTVSNKELREQLHVGPEWSPYKAWMDAREMLKEQAAEIERLRAAVQDMLSAMPLCDASYDKMQAAYDVVVGIGLRVLPSEYRRPNDSSAVSRFPPAPQDAPQDADVEALIDRLLTADRCRPEAGAKEDEDYRRREDRYTIARGHLLRALKARVGPPTTVTAEAIAKELDAMGWGTSSMHVKTPEFVRDLAAALAKLGAK